MKAFVGRFTEAIVQKIGPVATAETDFEMIEKQSVRRVPNPTA